MKRRIVAAGAVALALGACAKPGAVSVGPVGTTGHRTTSPTTPATTGAPTPTVTPTAVPPTTPPPSGTFTYEVWFAAGDNQLIRVWRTEPATQAVGRTALEALLHGPSATEIAGGAGTQVPPGTRLLGLSIAGGTATVDLSGEFFSGGSAVSQFLRIGQVVATITQFRTVHGVDVQLDGRPVRTFDIDGASLGRPWNRGDFEPIFPAIVVDSPAEGGAVSSPVRISGTADVFEATVSLRILDEHGTEIATGVTTATCGTGCRGTFTTTLAYDVGHTQRGTVEVFEASAKDGSPINVVRIPVTLGA